MNKFANFIVRHKIFFLILSLLLIIPSIIGFVKTKTNYDILVYLPSDIETLKGQKILTDDFKMGAFSVSVVENINDKELVKLEDQIREIPCVNEVVTINDITGTTIPKEMIPSDILDKVAKDDSKLMLITFSTGTSDDETIEAIDEISKLNSNVKVGGMSSLVRDTRLLVESQTLLYVIIAVICCFIVLSLALDSYVLPFILYDLVLFEIINFKNEKTKKILSIVSLAILSFFMLINNNELVAVFINVIVSLIYILIGVFRKYNHYIYLGIVFLIISLYSQLMTVLDSTILMMFLIIIGFILITIVLVKEIDKRQ